MRINVWWRIPPYKIYGAIRIIYRPNFLGLLNICNHFCRIANSKQWPGWYLIMCWSGKNGRFCVALWKPIHRAQCTRGGPVLSTTFRNVFNNFTITYFATHRDSSTGTLNRLKTCYPYGLWFSFASGERHDKIIKTFTWPWKHRVKIFLNENLWYRHWYPIEFIFAFKIDSFQQILDSKFE